MIALMTLTIALAGPAQDFQWSGTLAEGKSLSIKNIVGDIRVEPSTGRQVEIVAVKKAGQHGRVEDVEIRRVEDGNGIEVCVVYPNSRSDDGDCDWSDRRDDGRDRQRDSNRNDTRVEFTLKVPNGIELQVHTVAGDVLVRGIRGVISAASVSGDVEVTDVVAPALEARTVSGNVTLRGVDAAEVDGGTVSGDVLYAGRIQAQGDYAFETLSGDVELRIPPGTNADLSGSTFSGSIESDLPITMTSSRQSRNKKRMSGTLGSGGEAEISLVSFSGDVVIRVLP